jgi:hypothetical protein
MDPGQISFRPATQEDVPFLAELRQQTMHPHLRAGGLVAVLEQDMERVMFRFDCAKVILLADQPVGPWKVARDRRDTVRTRHATNKVTYLSRLRVFPYLLSFLCVFA